MRWNANSALIRSSWMARCASSRTDGSSSSMTWMSRTFWVSASCSASTWATSSKSSARAAASALSRRAHSAPACDGSTVRRTTSISTPGRTLAGPMASPGEAAMPWSARLLAKVLLHQFGQRGQRLGLVRALGAHDDGRTGLGGEHHEAEDALAVDLDAVAADEDLGAEARGEVDELRAGAGVEPDAVRDRQFGLDHGRSGKSAFRTTARPGRW